MKISYRVTILLSILVIFSNFNSVCQHAKIDSIWNIYHEAKTDSAQVAALVKGANQLIATNSDSATILLDKADSVVKSVKQVSPELALTYADLLREAGLQFRRASEYSKSIETSLKAIEFYISINNVFGTSKCYQNLGNVYYNLGNFDSALNYYYKALEFFNTSNNTIGIADCYNNIGSVLKEMESYDKAMEYHILSRDLFESLLAKPNSDSCEAVRKGLSNTFNNIGIIHWYQNNFALALSNYERALTIKKSLNDFNGVAQAYKNIAILYASQGKFEKGIEYFQKGLDIYLSTENKVGLTSVHSNIAYLNILLAESATSDKQKNIFLLKALTNAQHAFDIAKSISSKAYIGKAAEYLKEAYDASGNSSKALYYANELLSIQKDIFSEEKANALAQMTTRYEVEKNLLKLESMTKEKDFLKRITVNLIFISIGIITILSVLLFVLLLYFRQKRRANETLAERNEEIFQQKEEILAQLDELEEKQNKLEESKKKVESLYHTAIEQKETLEIQKVKIDDSIHYANFIQSALLPDLDTTFANRSWGVQSHFIMFRPKDVVSGDFYWATRIKDWIIFSIVDCTGHGVPGAFMSMLGISFMNEVVLSDDVTNPSKILQNLRSHVISALKQKEEWDSQRDGMDMSVLSMNTKTKQCFWAGANSPLWIVRAGKENSGSNAIPTIEEIKPNPFPVAVHRFMGEFTNHEITLKSGDRLYMFTDGFSDQFGGPRGKKFNMHKAFNKLIAKTSNLPIKEQGKVLEETFDNWITCDGVEYEQTDDVTVLGIMV